MDVPSIFNGTPLAAPTEKTPLIAENKKPLTVVGNRAASDFSFPIGPVNPAPSHFLAPSAANNSNRQWNYGSIREVSSSSCHPQGVLRRISFIYLDQTFQKELQELFACLPSFSSTRNIDNSAAPIQRDTLLELESYLKTNDHKTIRSSYDFPNLLHDLYQLQGNLAPTEFAHFAEVIIKKKTAEKNNLQQLAHQKEQALKDLCNNTSSWKETKNDFEEISSTLQLEIEGLNRKISFLNAFITYHQKALAVDNYLSCYNDLAYYRSFDSENRFKNFEAAAEALKKSLELSKKANAALLESVPTTAQNAKAKALFEKIARRDFEENHFEVVLCQDAIHHTPTTIANQWTYERLTKDLSFLSLKENFLRALQLV